MGNALRPNRGARCRAACLWLPIACALLMWAPGPALGDIDVLHADGNGLDIEVRAPFSITRPTDRGPATVSAPGWSMSDEPGRAALPYLVVPVALPPEGGFSAMVLSRHDTSAVAGELATGAYDTPIGLPDDVAPEDYAAPGVSPMVGRIVTTEIIGKAGDVRVGRVIVNPARYDGSRLSWASRLTLAIRFDRPVENAATRRGRIASSNMEHPASFVVNDAQLDGFRTDRPAAARTARTTAQTNPRIRLVLYHEGMYRIEGAELVQLAKDAGFDFAGVDPRTLTLTDRDEQIPLYVENESRGVVDEKISLEFYGKPNVGRYQDQAPDLYRDPYVDAGFYWLSWGQGNGARMIEETATEELGPFEVLVPAQYCDHTIHAERDYTTEPFERVSNPLVDNNLWGTVTNLSSGSFNIELAPLKERGLSFSLRVMARGASISDHIMRVTLSDPGGSGTNLFVVGSIGEDGSIRNNDLIDFRATVDTENDYLPLIDGTNTVIVSAEKPNSRIGVNWIELTYPREYRATDDQLAFRSPDPETPGVYDYLVRGFTVPDITLYKVGVSRLKSYQIFRLDPSTFSDFEIDPQEAPSYAVRFQDRSVGDDVRFLALTDDEKLSPERMDVVFPRERSLRDPSRSADYLVIAHPSLADSAQRLANYRRSEQGGGYDVELVSTDQIYDEFDYGYPTAESIQSFIRYAATNWTEPHLQYVLILGHGEVRFNSQNLFGTRYLVPALKTPLRGFGRSGSDHGYGLLDDDDILSDLFVGRISAWNATQLGVMTTKIINFEQGAERTPWRQRMALFGSGASNEQTFSIQCELLSADLPKRYYQIKHYTGAVEPELEAFLGTHETAMDVLDEGAIWTSYVGHGAGGIWGYNKILNFEDVPFLLNNRKTGVFLSMTCFTGAYEGSRGEIALGESMMFDSEDAGAIAWYGATGLGWLRNDFFLLQSYIRNGIAPEYDNRSLGRIVTNAENDYLLRFGSSRAEIGSIPHTMVFSFNLLGDPGIRMRPPANEVALSLSERTPDAGQVDTITGILPSSITGTANVSLYNRNQMPIEVRENVPVTQGRFMSLFTIPDTLDGESLWVKSYVHDESGESDFVGATRMVVGETLIDDVTVHWRARDDIEVSATLYDRSGIDQASCIVALNAQGATDSIPMAQAQGTDTWKTTRPIDMSAVQSLDEKLVLNASLRIVDGDGTNTLHENVVQISPNLIARLDVDGMSVELSDSVIVTAAVRNIGSLESDSVTIQAWRVGEPDVLLAERTVPPLAPILTSDPNNEVAIGARPGRRAVEDTPVLHQIFPRIPLPDDIFGAGSSTIRCRLTATTRDGGSTDASEMKLPTGIAVYAPAATDTTTATSSDGRFALRLAPGFADRRVLVRAIPMSPPERKGQPEIAPYVSTSVLQGIVCRVTRSDSALGEWSMEAVLRMAVPGDAALQSLILSGAARVGRWIASRSQWELLPSESTTFLPGAVEIPVTSEGIFALVGEQDDLPPTIEVTVGGQHFSDGGYVTAVSSFHILVEDRNGVSSARESIRVWVDDVAVPDSLVSIAELAEAPSALAAVVRLDTELPDGGTRTMRVAAEDMVGNEAETEITFRVTDTNQILFWGNFPNPFQSDGTRFAFELTQRALSVEFRIFDVAGRQVLRFDNYDMTQLRRDDASSRSEGGNLTDSNGQLLVANSYHEIVWDGRDGHGRQLANGVYFGLITVVNEQGDEKATHTFKMVKAE